jgi:hypothetical protein
MKEDIKKLLREASGDGDSSNAQYDRIQRLLDNNIFNHAEIVEKLWGKGEKDDASQRSLFRKKLNRETYQGTKYEFDETELTKIAQILMDTSSIIRKNLGKVKK